jgi:hypothetical protein
MCNDCGSRQFLTSLFWALRAFNNREPKDWENMKKLIPLLVLLAGTAGALAQGIVNFNNNNLTPTTQIPDRLVRSWESGPILGSASTEPPSFVAQLYWSTDGGNSLTAHTATPARFRPAGLNPAGTWLGGNRTLPAGVGGVGTTVTLQVRVWDSVGGTLTYDQAVAQGRPRGASSPFAYSQIASIPPGASDIWMQNFAGFTFSVPEPSVIGLAVVGAGALFLLRRRK